MFCSIDKRTCRMAVKRPSNLIFCAERLYNVIMCHDWRDDRTNTTVIENDYTFEIAHSSGHNITFLYSSDLHK